MRRLAKALTAVVLAVPLAVLVEMPAAHALLPYSKGTLNSIMFRSLTTRTRQFSKTSA